LVWQCPVSTQRGWILFAAPKYGWEGPRVVFRNSSGELVKVGGLAKLLVMSSSEKGAVVQVPERETLAGQEVDPEKTDGFLEDYEPPVRLPFAYGYDSGVSVMCTMIQNLTKEGRLHTYGKRSREIKKRATEKLDVVWDCVTCVLAFDEPILNQFAPTTAGFNYISDTAFRQEAGKVGTPTLRLAEATPTLAEEARSDFVKMFDGQIALERHIKFMTWKERAPLTQRPRHSHDFAAPSWFDAVYSRK
jgi:hypothetical protein